MRSTHHERRPRPSTRPRRAAGMTTFERFEGDLPMLLEELAPPRTPDYLDSVFGRTARSAPAARLELPRKVAPDVNTHRSDGDGPTRPVAPDPHPRPAPRSRSRRRPSTSARSSGGCRRPFGPAANGLIPYVAPTGDIYLGDPVTGTTRLLVGGPEADGLVGFSPDGTSVAFIRPVGTGAGELPVDVYVVRGRLRPATDHVRADRRPALDLLDTRRAPGQSIHPVEARSPSASAPRSLGCRSSTSSTSMAVARSSPLRRPTRWTWRSSARPTDARS